MDKLKIKINQIKSIERSCIISWNRNIYPDFNDYTEVLHWLNCMEVSSEVNKSQISSPILKLFMALNLMSQPKLDTERSSTRPGLY